LGRALATPVAGTPTRPAINTKINMLKKEHSISSVRKISRLVFGSIVGILALIGGVSIARWLTTPKNNSEIVDLICIGKNEKGEVLKQAFSMTPSDYEFYDRVTKKYITRSDWVVTINGVKYFPRHTKPITSMGNLFFSTTTDLFDKQRIVWSNYEHHDPYISSLDQATTEGYREREIVKIDRFSHDWEYYEGKSRWISDSSLLKYSVETTYTGKCDKADLL